MKPITVLSLVEFTETQLGKLKAVSPLLDVRQKSNATFDDLPDSLRNSVEILYGWGKTVAAAHQFPRLKWIQTHSAGVDFLHNKPVWQSNVIISNISGIHATPMAEYALAMILAFRWKVSTMLRYQRQSEWVQGRWDVFAGPELRGSTLGILGYGAIGRETGRQGKALGMRVLVANRSGKRRPFYGYNESGVGDPQATIPETVYTTSSLQKMLPECDYLVIAAPLTSNTRHIINAQTLRHMKPGAFLVNLSRGGLVDEKALITALQQKQIAGAGLDVFQEEPLAATSPLWKLDNVIISPHVSGFTSRYDDRASNLFAENLRRYLNKEPLLNLINKERGY